MALARVLILLALPLAAFGCGGGGGEDDRPPVRGDTLTIYSSLPRHGTSEQVSAAVTAGQRLALADAGARVAGYRVRLVQRDNADPDDDVWDPDVVERNAERAADDDTTIAYVGELDLGGSAISLPVLNKAGILQVSPGDGLTSLTRTQPGDRAAPERFYPAGRRTFLRLVPNDLLQAGALVAWACGAGAARLAVVHDDQVYGRELAAQLAQVAARERLRVTAVEEVRERPEGYAELALGLADEAPEAVIYAGYSDRVAGPLFAALAEALPGARRFASSGTGAAAFEAAGPVRALSTLRRPRDYPPAGRELLRRLGPAAAGEPVAGLYGYESVRLVLDAIGAAGGGAGDRAAVVREALAPRVRRSVIGQYSVQRSGDVSETRFAGWVHAAGSRRFGGMRDSTGAAGPGG